jgi:hypothetical protein
LGGTILWWWQEVEVSITWILLTMVGDSSIGTEETKRVDEEGVTEDSNGDGAQERDGGKELPEEEKKAATG